MPHNFPNLPAASSVLIIGHPNVTNKEIESHLTQLRSQLGSSGLVHFEQFDRITSFLPSEPIYTHLILGYIRLPTQPHSPTVINQMFHYLKPQGQLHLRELGIQSRDRTLTSRVFNLRTLEELTISLKMNGFIHVHVTSCSLSEDEERVVCQSWQLNSLSELPEDIVCLKLIAEKPPYELGATLPLPLKLKKNNFLPPSAEKVPIWTINTTDETIPNIRSNLHGNGYQVDEDDDENDDGFLNDDDLLDDLDFLKPIYADPNAGCETKKKACKNCTCGRAEMEQPIQFNTSTTTTSVSSSFSSNSMSYSTSTTNSLILPQEATSFPSSTKISSTSFTSSCGSCYLGDAFRCASCPYLGMPSFKPGEQVKLTDNLMSDDIVL